LERDNVSSLLQCNIDNIYYFNKKINCKVYPKIRFENK
jgi:hypothetical protein